jgi:oligogalacturonide lyase
MVIFTSNMFGPSYVFGVETAKATIDPTRDKVLSTPDIGEEFNPGTPPPTGTPAPTR